MASSDLGHACNDCSAASSGDATLAGLRILVVDDDADTRSLQKTIFVRAGAIVAEAESAAVAFQALRDFKPHLLVCDIHMPEEDGCFLMRRVRALATELGGSIPAIAVTGGSSSTVRGEALRSGFSAHLTKPVAVGELLATAVALIGAAER
jgi:CheY-like chemotaxis protein